MATIGIELPQVGESVTEAVIGKWLKQPGDTVEKFDDRDGDGDPDVITIRLEVMELNGRSPDMPDVIPQFEIAPGITPGLWLLRRHLIRKLLLSV